MIGDDIKISVLGVKGNQIRIGVSAPREVAVHREEIFQRIQEEQLEQQTQPVLHEQPEAHLTVVNSE